MSLTGLNSSRWQDCIHSGDLRGEVISFPFLAAGGCQFSLVVGTYMTCKGSKDELSFLHHITLTYVVKSLSASLFHF